MATSTIQPLIKNILQAQCIGDSVGLPYEFLRKDKTLQRLNKYQGKQSFIFDIGMCSDDAEHACITALSLAKSKNPKEFAINLSSYLRLWMLSFPPGIGATTLKACVKLLLGSNAKNSGINSAGNGPLMRVPVISAALHRESKVLRDEFIKTSCIITHNNPVAIEVCLACSDLISYLCVNKDRPDLTQLSSILLRETASNTWKKQVLSLLQAIEQHTKLKEKLGPKEILDLVKFPPSLGFDISKGVSGFIVHSFISSLFCFMLYNSCQAGIKSCLSLAGDTDSTTALLCSFYACLPSQLGFVYSAQLNSILLPPLNEKELNKLGVHFADDEFLEYPNKSDFNKQFMFGFYLKLLWKNLLQLPLIYSHLIRRMFKY